MTANAVRPLIVRCGALGDMVILAPLIERLSQRYGAPVDVLSSGPWTPPLLAMQPAVGRVTLLTSRKTPYWLCPSQWRAVAELRRRPRGPVYFCDDTVETRKLLDRAGIPEQDRVEAYAPGRGERDETAHWLDRWQKLAERSPAAWPAVSNTEAGRPFVPRLQAEASVVDETRSWLASRGLAESPLVLFQPGNKRTLKRGKRATQGHHKHWPAENWAALAKAVITDLSGGQVLLCGAPQEFDVLEEIRQHCAGLPVHNLARELPIHRLVALASVAQCMIAVDSGPAHVAAAVDCPLLVLFGAASPALWAPRSAAAPVVCIGGAPDGRSRVDEIAAEEAVAAWRQRLLPQLAASR